MTERLAQKRKTKADLLAGARALIGRGEAVTVTAAARESGVSKATAYRYYSDPALLAAEAGLAYRMKSYEEITDGTADLKEKLVAISLHFFDLAIENEPAFRTYLGLFLQASASSLQEPPERGARRIAAYDRALAETDHEMSADRATLLSAALGVGTGPEAMIALLDVARLQPREARRVVREIAEGIVDRFL